MLTALFDFSKKAFSTSAIYNQLSGLPYSLLFSYWLFFIVVGIVFSSSIFLIRLPKYESIAVSALSAFVQYFPQSQSAQWNGTTLTLKENPSVVYLSDEIKPLVPSSLNSFAVLDTREKTIDTITYTGYDPLFLISSQEIGFRNNYQEYLPLDLEAAFASLDPVTLDQSTIHTDITQLTNIYAEKKWEYLSVAAASFSLLSIAASLIITLYLYILTLFITLIHRRMLGKTLPPFRIAVTLSIPALLISQITSYFFSSTYTFTITEIYIFLLTFILLSEQDTLLKN